MLGFVVRLGCAVLLLVVSVLLALILTVLASATPSHAAGWVAVGPIRLAAAQHDAPAAAGVQGIFLHEWVDLPPLAPGCTWRLAGDAAGSAPLRVDDRLVLIGAGPNGRRQQWSHDFRVGDHIVALPPLDPAALNNDARRVEVQLEDLAPPTWGNSDLWLVPCPPSRPAPTTVLPTPTRLLAAFPSPTMPVSFTNLPASDGESGAFLSLYRPDALLTSAGLLLGGVLLALIARQAARRRQQRAGRVSLLTVYDAAGRAPLQQMIRLTDLPLGIAFDPLRLVAGGTPGIEYLLGFPYPGAVPVLFCRQRGGLAPLVLLNGDRLAQVTTDREAHDARVPSG